MVSKYSCIEIIDFNYIFFTLYILTYSEWFLKKPFSISDNLYEDAMNYSIQFTTTYFEYNDKIIQDNMYDTKNGWTINFKNLIKNRYYKVKGDHINSEIIIL